jgi:tripartite-type tricarboxylate transporter receptor subunit TctC
MSSYSLTRRSALAAGIAALTSQAFAQVISRPVTFMVPQPAGNPTDAVARKLQPLLQKELGQAVPVENMPGAGGSLGIQRALNTPAGVPVLVIASQTEPILTPLTIASARYKSEDLRPIALIGRTPYVLAGRPDLPATTLPELVDLVRRSRGKALSHGNVGPGSMIHLLGEQWARMTGVEFLHVVYKGLPPMVQDLMGGQIDLGFLPLGGNTLALIESGKVRAFGVTSGAPSKRLPRLPLISKQAPELSAFVHDTWAAVFVPRSLPEPIVEKLHEALAKAVEDPDIKTYSMESGAEPAERMTLAQLDRFYEAETRTYRGMARSIGIKPE